MYEYPAKLLRVIDGDTIAVDIDLGFAVHTITIVRFLGINAPEMSTPKGKVAREVLIAKLNAAPAGLMLKTALEPAKAGDPKQEKYGRWLAVVWVNGENVNEWMVANGYAVPFMVVKRKPRPGKGRGG